MDSLKSGLAGLGLALALVATGCSAQPAASPAAAAPPPVQSQPVQPTPTTTPMPTPTGAPVVGAATMQMSITGGYKANVEFTWHRLADLTTQQVQSKCPQLVNPFGTTTPHAYKGIGIDFTVEYPNVNGFVWPAEDKIKLEPGSDVHGGVWCIDATSDVLGIFAIPSSAASDRTVHAIYLFYGEKTPDNPNGKFPEGMEKMSILTAPAPHTFPPLQTCDVVGAPNLAPKSSVEGRCEIGYPAAQ